MSDDAVKTKIRPAPVSATAIPEPIAEMAMEAAAETAEIVTEASVEIAAAEAETVTEVATTAAEAAVETMAETPIAPTTPLRTWALAEHSARRLLAMAEAGAVLSRGAQEVSRSWLSASQEGLKLQREGFRRVAACRTPLDLVAAEGDLALRGLDTVMAAGQTVARISTKAVTDAGDALRVA